MVFDYYQICYAGKIVTFYLKDNIPQFLRASYDHMMLSGCAGAKLVKNQIEVMNIDGSTLLCNMRHVAMIQ